MVRWPSFVAFMERFSLPENSKVAWTRQSAFPKPDQLMLSEMEDEVCFECLQRRIQTDLSGNLTFLYGISRSALPFGSRAVVQVSLCSLILQTRCFLLIYFVLSYYFLTVSFFLLVIKQLSNSTGDVSARFRLVYIRSSEYDCLTKYV